MEKVMTMQRAVAEFVKPGNTVFISGMQHGEPAAAIHEIVRQKIDHLTIICVLIATSNLLVGEGLLDKVLTGYFNQDERGYALTKAKAAGRRPVFEEYSHFGISLALMAGQMGVPFIPTRSEIGSDLAEYNDNITSVKCPFTGESIGAVRAVNPDVGIIHVQRCDAEGNAQKWGTMGIDSEGINASKNIIITTEKIVDSEVIRRDPNRTIIPGYRVAAVVEQPWGAFPMHLAGCYSSDWPGFLAEISTEDKYDDFIENYVYGVSDWNEFMKLWRDFKGEEYFKRFEVKLEPSDPIYSGWEEVG